MQNSFNRIQYFKMTIRKYLWTSAILAMLVINSSEQASSSNTSIYGIRWFLGDHFTYTINDSNDNNEYFVLAFNSQDKLEGELSAKIGNNRFTCTSEFVSTQQLTIHHSEVANFSNDVGDDVVDQAYLHKCIIGDIRAITKKSNIKTVNYSITLDNLYITQSASPTIDKSTHISLYSSIFRLPYYQSSFQAIVIGDWGQIREQGNKKGFVDPLPCILKKLQENPNIVMMLFTGDLAYDLQGGKYYSMLKYMEPLTSKITFVAAPGNHDTLYHADTFQLFTKTYYTPQWWSYSNYFSKFTIGKLLFIFYNPQLQQFDFTRPDRLKKNLTTVFEKEFTPEIISSIKSSYFPIVVSHYPIYCSNINDDVDSCDRNPERFKVYREYFNKLDMKLYLSGHLHVYERSAPICFNGSFIKANSEDYNMTCPVYIVEGTGGNDFYVQMKQQYPKKNFSSALVYNTGFGILTINSASELSYPDNVSYQHISATNCSAADHFKMTNTVLNQNLNNAGSSDNYSYFWRIMVKLAVLSLLASALFIIFMFLRRRCWKATPLIKSDKNIHQDNHVEMVQQNFDAPQSDKGEKTSQ